MRQLLLAVMAACLLISCSNYGKRVSIEKSEVFYKGDGVTEADAKKVGDFLLQHGLFTKDSKSSAQLTKDSGMYVVRLIIDSAKSDPAFRLHMWAMQNDLAKEAFNGFDTRFAFTNDEFKNAELLGPVNSHSFGKAVVYYDSKAITSSAIDDLSDFLQKQGLISGENDANIFVRNENNQPVVRIVYDKDYYSANTQQVNGVMGYLQYVLQNNYPAFKDASIWLTTKEYADFQKIATLDKEQVAQMVAASNAQANTAATPAAVTDSTNMQQ